jgi:hypothetical protein
MDASCKIQGSIHVFHLVHKYVSRILGTYHLAKMRGCFFRVDHVKHKLEFYHLSFGVCESFSVNRDLKGLL